MTCASQPELKQIGIHSLYTMQLALIRVFVLTNPVFFETLLKRSLFTL